MFFDSYFDYNQPDKATYGKGPYAEDDIYGFPFSPMNIGSYYGNLGLLAHNNQKAGLYGHHPNVGSIGVYQNQSKINLQSDEMNGINDSDKLERSSSKNDKNGERKEASNAFFWDDTISDFSDTSEDNDNDHTNGKPFLYLNKYPFPLVSDGLLGYFNPMYKQENVLKNGPYSNPYISYNNNPELAFGYEEEEVK